MEEDLKFVPPSVVQIVERSLANFTNQQGIQKLYSLLEATESLRQFLIVNYGKEQTIKEIEIELKKVNFNKIKTYDDLMKSISGSRKAINESQIIYDIAKGKKDSEKSSSEKQISKKISPYQSGLYFLFMVLLKLSGLQNKSISRELLRSPDEAIKSEKQFEKQK